MYLRGIRFFIPKTLSFFKKRLSSFILSGHFAKKDEFLGTDCKPLEKKIEEIRKENNDFIFLNNQKYEAAIKRTKQDLLILKKLFEKQGIPFYVVVLDSYIQNQPQFWEIYAKAEKGSTWFQNNKGPYRKNHDWLIDLKNKTGLRLVFTLDKFWNHEGVPLFIPHDGHINAAGAVKVSEVIMEAISGSMNLDAVEF